MLIQIVLEDICIRLSSQTWSRGAISWNTFLGSIHFTFTHLRIGLLFLHPRETHPWFCFLRWDHFHQSGLSREVRSIFFSPFFFLLFWLFFSIIFVFFSHYLSPYILSEMCQCMLTPPEVKEVLTKRDNVWLVYCSQWGLWQHNKS